MKIYYRKSGKQPSEGDMKVLNNGDTFFRRQRRYNGCFVVSNGRPSYEWYRKGDETIQREEEAFEKKGFDLFSSTSETKTRKSRKLHLDFSKETDRKRYEQLVGVKVDENTTVKTATLDVVV